MCAASTWDEGFQLHYTAINTSKWTAASEMNVYMVSQHGHYIKSEYSTENWLPIRQCLNLDLRCQYSATKLNFIPAEVSKLHYIGCTTSIWRGSRAQGQHLHQTPSF